MSEALERIDPALAAMGEFGRLSPGTVRPIHAMRQAAIFADGVLPARHKALAAVLWSISARCEPCVKFYAAEARRLEATKEELGEFLGVAAAMGGCVGETWAVKALHAFNASEETATDAACCAGPASNRPAEGPAPRE